MNVNYDNSEENFKLIHQFKGLKFPSAKHGEDVKFRYFLVLTQCLNVYF